MNSDTHIKSIDLYLGFGKDVNEISIFTSPYP